MAATFGDLVAEVESFLYGYFTDRDKVTSLTNPINTTDLTLVVDDATQVDAGFIEIDNELVAVKAVNQTANTITVHPWGRGQRGTTAATHAAGARVAVNPRFPRYWIRTEINTSIQNLFPDLFAVATDRTNTLSPVVTTYPLPAAAETVLKVAWQTTGPSGAWMPVKRYRFDYTADTTTYPTGRTIDIGDATTPGRVLQVVYAKQFGTLAADADALTSVGLKDDWRDIIKLDVCARMLLSVDGSRMNPSTVEVASKAPQPLASVAIAGRLAGAAQLRVAQERAQLLREYPTMTTMRG